jgi:phage FluMu protein Com
MSLSEFYDFNCVKCHRLLGKVKDDTEITCPRCGGINRIRFPSMEIEYKSRLRKMKERQTSSGKSFD